MLIQAQLEKWQKMAKETAEAFQLIMDERDAALKEVERLKALLALRCRFEIARIEWFAVVKEVDQYGEAFSHQEALYKSQPFASKQEAEEHLNSITTLNKFNGERIWNEATHTYHRCYVEYRRSVVETFS